MEESKFLQLSKKDAQNLAEKNNLIFRLVSVDGNTYLGYPSDIRDDRVCVELIQNKVVVAKLQ